MCTNFIGTGQGRICLRARKLFEDNYGINHQGGKALLDEDTLFIWVDKNVAYTSTNLPILLIVGGGGGEAEVEDLLSITDKTASDWSAMFAVYHQVGDPSEVTCRIRQLNKTSPISTPWKQTSGISDNIIHEPVTQYMSFYNKEMANNIEMHAGISMATIIHKMDQGIIGLNDNLAKVASEANNYAMVAEQNREKMETDIWKLQSAIGNPAKIDGQTFPTVWSGLAYLSAKGAEDSQMSPEVKARIDQAVKAASKVGKLQAGMKQMATFCTSMTTKLAEMNAQLAGAVAS
jgi:hypothetical protein